ncbi:MAG: hypothetical protein OEO17_10625, partial [Gemmatimonadota bacterium]|nr:hypothetical protein [Gemmatimonadota bacterium]
MNRRFTGTDLSAAGAGARSGVGCCAFRLASGLALALLLPAVGTAQDTPGPSPNLQRISMGSLIIPMDGKQTLVAPFNISAYGLVNDFLQNNIPVKWAIRAGKAKDGVDFTGQARQVAPTTGGTSLLTFAGGPFIVDKAYASLALARVSAFGRSVVVYELTQDTIVDVRHQMTFKPRAFVNTVNASIATDILNAAGITNYTVGTDFSLLAGSCYTLAMEPHNDNPVGVGSIRAFLESGGNFLAQCRSVDTYENDATNGRFLTTLGITTNNIGNTLTYPNPDLSFSQFVGALEPAPGGSHQDWQLLPGSALKAGSHVHADNVGASPPTYAALVGKVYGGQGGLAFYLGGHDWAGMAAGMVNGQRMMLNALMTPPTRPPSCGLTISLPDLTIAKSHVGNFIEGSTGTYTITVTNVGNRATVDTLTVTDTLPAGLTFVSGSGTGWTVSAVGQVVTARYPATLGIGANAGFTLTVSVGAAAYPSVTNTARVSGGGELNTANNIASDPTTVIRGVIGKVFEDANGNGVQDGTETGIASVTVVVTSGAFTGSGVTDATGVWSVVGVPAGVATVDVDDTTLPPGAVQTAGTDPSTVNVVAGVPADAGVDGYTGIVADVRVTKTGPDSAAAAATIRYVLVTTNLGPAAAPGVVLRDTLPAGVTFTSATRGGTLAGNVVTWPAVTLANGASLTDSVTVVTPSATATLVNIAASTSTRVDPVPGNNNGSGAAARVTTQVVYSADLAITKTDGVTSVPKNGPLTYTIVVSNVAGLPTTGASVTDVFPSGVTSVTWTCAGAGGATCGAASGSGNINGVLVTVPVGGTASFTATGTASGAGTLVNTATVTAPAGVTDPVAANNTATDDNTVISPIRISSAANQKFNQNGPLVAISTITVTDAAAPAIKAATDLRIRIPAGFPMTWDTGDGLATIGGSAAAKVSNAVRYEDAGHTLVVPVTTDFSPLDQLTIADLSYANFTALTPVDSLELVAAGPGGPAVARDDKTIAVLDPYGISSASNQTFVVGDAATAAGVIRVTDHAGIPTITAGNEIRIRIPTGFPMTWNTAVTTVTVGGSAAGKVKTTLKGYEDGGKTAVVDVDVNFAAGDQLTITGLQFMSFTAAAAADRLGLDVTDDQVADALDDKTKAIGAPQFTSAAHQNFTVGGAPRAISPITVTEYASFGTVTAARDLRIRIPTGFPMTWETGDVAATLGGSAAGKVSPTVSYENGGRTLRLDVLTDFVPGDVLTISDLSYANFTASAALNQLELVLAGAGATAAARDLRSISVGAATISSAANQTFVVGDAATTAAVITVTDDAVAPTINSGKEIRIRIPTAFPMTWNTAVTTVTVGGSAAAKVKTVLKNYEDGGKTAVVDVDVNFVAGDQLTITGLQFMNFTAAAAAARL